MFTQIDSDLLASTLKGTWDHSPTHFEFVAHIWITRVKWWSVCDSYKAMSLWRLCSHVHVTQSQYRLLTIVMRSSMKAHSLHCRVLPHRCWLFTEMKLSNLSSFWVGAIGALIASKTTFENWTVLKRNYAIFRIIMV